MCACARKARAAASDQATATNRDESRWLLRQSESTTALRVLVVEDDALLGLVLAETLEDMGYDVCAIEATEAGAVASAARYRPDLMTVDVRLRHGSGISAVERILLTGFIPHVFVSGDTSRGVTLMPGAAVIHKPFREADLAQAIRRALTAAPKP